MIYTMPPHNAPTGGYSLFLVIGHPSSLYLNIQKSWALKNAFALSKLHLAEPWTGISPQKYGEI